MSIKRKSLWTWRRQEKETECIKGKAEQRKKKK